MAAWNVHVSATWKYLFSCFVCFQFLFLKANNTPGSHNNESKHNQTRLPFPISKLLNVQFVDFFFFVALSRDIEMLEENWRYNNGEIMRPK